MKSEKRRNGMAAARDRRGVNKRGWVSQGLRKEKRARRRRDLSRGAAARCTRRRQRWGAGTKADGLPKGEGGRGEAGNGCQDGEEFFLFRRGSGSPIRMLDMDTRLAEGKIDI